MIRPTLGMSGNMLELSRNLQVLRRWWWLILAATLIGGLVAYILTKLLVQQQYEGTAVISMAPPPQSSYGLSMLAASADAQLLPTLSTAQSARRQLPTSLATTIDSAKLARSITALPSIDGQLLFVKVRWPDQNVGRTLTNAVANGFMVEERRRIEARYRVIHSGLVQEEHHLSSLIRRSRGQGPAQNWLQSQYADTAARVFQADADSRIQATMQEMSLQLAQPASTLDRVGPKATLNAVLGAVLALLVAIVLAFTLTVSYDGTIREERLHPVLTKVGE